MVCPSLKNIIFAEGGGRQAGRQAGRQGGREGGREGGKPEAKRRASGLTSMSVFGSEFELTS